MSTIRIKWRRIWNFTSKNWYDILNGVNSFIQSIHFDPGLQEWPGHLQFLGDWWPG